MKEKSTENFSDQKNHSSNDIAINPAVDESFLNTPFAALPNSALADQSSTQADVELNELQRLRLVPPTIQELEANDFALIKAAAKKQKILDFYYSIAIEDCSRIPWFHWAALCNQIETIKVHLNEGGNSLCIDLQNRTPAMLAVEIGHLELFEVLLYDKNYNFSQRDIKGNTLANYMVKNNRLDCIESLLSYIDFHHQQRINPQKSTEEQLYYKNLAGEAAYTFIKVLYLASYDDKNLELFKILLSMYRNMLQKETGKAQDEAAAKIAFSHIVNKLAYRAAYYNQLAILDYLIEEQLINIPPEFERSNSSVFSQFLQQLKLRHVIDNFKSLEKEFEPAVKRVLPPAYWQDFINRLDYLRQLINDTLEDESLKMPILSYLDQSEAHANQLIVLNNDQSEYDKYKNYLRFALDKLWQAGYQLEITLDIQEGRRPRQINNYTLKQVPSFPTEVWLSILALTDSTSLVNIQKVDHMLDQVSQDDYIWKNLFINFFPEEQPDEAADGISWKETFKTHYLEQYGSANRRTKKLISLIIRGDLDALKSCEISSRDLLVDNLLLLKTAARANNQTALDYFYSLVFTETMRSREDLGALTPEIRNQQEVFLFFWAALCNQRETIRLNLEHTPTAIDWSEHQGRTITMLAAEIGHVRLFQDLLRRPNSSKNRLLAPYVAKNGSRDLFLTLVSPDYEHGDIDQASGFDWNKSSRRFRIIVPEVLRHAAQYGQMKLIRFMLKTKAVDFKSALNATIVADNIPLLRKLRALTIEKGDEVYKNILSDRIKVVFGGYNRDSTLWDSNLCVEFLLKDPLVDISANEFRLFVGNQKTSSVQKIFERPGAPVRDLANLLDPHTKLPIVYLLPRNSEMQKLLLPHVDLQEILYEMIIQKASLMHIRNIIHFNDHVLKRPPIKKQVFFNFAEMQDRKRITDVLKIEIDLEKKLETAEISSEQKSFEVLKQQVIATGLSKGLRYGNNHTQQPAKIKFPQDLLGLSAFQNLLLTDPAQSASLENRYEEAYKEGVSKAQKAKIEKETKKRKPLPDAEDEKPRKKSKENLEKAEAEKPASGKRKSRSHSKPEKETNKRQKQERSEKKASPEQNELLVAEDNTMVMPVSIPTDNAPTSEEKTKKLNSRSSDYSWRLRLFGSPKTESQPSPTDSKMDEEIDVLEKGNVEEKDARSFS